MKILNMKQIVQFIILLLAGLCFLTSCSKDSASTEKINSINPTHGPKDTTVVISGGGFGSIVANASVYFNGHQANIVSISNTKIVATVPTLAGTGPVSVSINSKSVSGPVFTYDTTYAI